jgi:hypothetical protein
MLLFIRTDGRFHYIHYIAFAFIALYCIALRVLHSLRYVRCVRLRCITLRCITLHYLHYATDWAILLMVRHVCS